MNMTSVEAYPLHWPPGRPRTSLRKSAPFRRKTREQTQYGTWTRSQRLTIEDSQSRVRHELQLMGAKSVIISSNLELRNDGLPRSNQRRVSDPGVAVYFQWKNQPHCLSCDKWNRAADNLAAIAKHVESMRGQLRWGVADVATMFAGFRALPNAIITPSAMSVEDAAAFVANQSGSADRRAPLASADAFKSMYREAAKLLHPDANAGAESDEWHLLQQAAQILREHHHADAT